MPNAAMQAIAPVSSTLSGMLPTQATTGSDSCGNFGVVVGVSGGSGGGLGVATGGGLCSILGITAGGGGETCVALYGGGGACGRFQLCMVE